MEAGDADLEEAIRMDLEVAAGFPAHVHRLSPMLTLQGAVAHVDMPVESGPTMYLPHSQRYEPGYLAIGLPEFGAYFERHHVQLPLEKGDAVFFNPAVLHGSGTNRAADVQRMANLLQISSAFGRALSRVDSERVAAAVYPTLRARRAAGSDQRSLRNVVAVAAEGYPYPTNLDHDRPVGSLNPESQAQLLWRALEHDWDEGTFDAELAAHTERHRSSLSRGRGARVRRLGVCAAGVARRPSGRRAGASGEPGAGGCHAHLGPEGVLRAPGGGSRRAHGGETDATRAAWWQRGVRRRRPSARSVRVVPRGLTPGLGDRAERALRAPGLTPGLGDRVERALRAPGLTPGA